jgi:hypothetical protein
MHLEDKEIVNQIKWMFAPDGGAEREHNARPGTLGFGLIHYALVRNLKPVHALAIGSRYGYIPSIISLALKENGQGCLDFVDANYDDARDGFARAFGGTGFWIEGGERFTLMGLQEVIKIHLMRSEDFFQECNKIYDYIYLDADHSYHGCRFDLDAVLGIASPAALITLHDILVSGDPFGVDRVFSELDRNTYNTMIIPVWPGLGIIQRKETA